MYTVILAIHIVICFLLILAVLIQSGKGSSLGSAFGGGAGDVFGPGAPVNIMNKVTTVIAIIFMLTSLTLAVLSTQKTTSSIMQSNPAGQQAPAETKKPVIPMESK
jgi:preprotein translocase subunit SecG